MIFGHPDHKEVKIFAWYPVRLETGEWVWLQYVYLFKYWFFGMHHHIYRIKSIHSDD